MKYDKKGLNWIKKREKREERRERKRERERDIICKLIE